MAVRKATFAVALALAAAAAVAGAARAETAAQARAHAALVRAEAALEGRSGREPTIALRDLVRAEKSLTPTDKIRASALVDRPTISGNPRGYTVPSTFTCSNVCIHWVTTTKDAPPLHDADADGIPDWVETTLAVFDTIWAKEVVQFGFRAPKSDEMLREHGPDGRLDVYLVDIADDVLGYCSPEVPQDYEFWDVPGHCVIDNDYTPAQLGSPNASGRLALERNAAHEFFHVVQFAYDFNEDGWLMEGTATWVEDEVFDALDGSYGWFPYTALAHPEVPIDTWSRSQPFQYGSWLFFRFFQELFSPENGPRDPTVVRRIWEWADGSPGGPDLYSIAAVDATAREHGLSLRPVFAAFGVANVLPRGFYRDGASYPSAQRAATHTLSRTRPSTGARRVTLDHLTNASIEFRPGASLTRAARLRVALDLPSVERGSAATLLVSRTGGQEDVSPVRLDLAGNASFDVPFARNSVRRVVVVLTNASARYRCARRTSFACAGQPVDDRLPFRYRATVR